jgi:hypothetical protein
MVAEHLCEALGLKSSTTKKKNERKKKGRKEDVSIER